MTAEENNKITSYSLILFGWVNIGGDDKGVEN
jgi:hypothetical protein